ncbi:MAG: dTMP kinase [Chloroflexi bacterium]|jgi:dTMP kinase|nr:dTMP kinase [Chloroflexota bacterium]
MGLFILFEGVEGCGKSTQARALEKRLSKLGVPVIRVKEPGSTSIGRVARKLLKHRLEIEINPVTELLLFAVARSQLVAEIIRPALERDQIVICDRYSESTLAYQGYGRGVDLDTIHTINNIATGGLRPDLIILPDIDVHEGLKRKGAKQSTDRFEREEISFHHRVRQGYLDMSSAEPNRWLILDATQPRKKIGDSIWESIQQHLPIETLRCLDSQGTK